MDCRSVSVNNGIGLDLTGFFMVNAFPSLANPSSCFHHLVFRRSPQQVHNAHKHTPSTLVGNKAGLVRSGKKLRLCFASHPSGQSISPKQTVMETGKKTIRNSSDESQVEDGGEDMCHESAVFGGGHIVL